MSKLQWEDSKRIDWYATGLPPLEDVRYIKFLYEHIERLEQRIAQLEKTNE